MASERGCILMPFSRAASRPASPPRSLLLPPLVSVGSVKTSVKRKFLAAPSRRAFVGGSTGNLLGLVLGSR